DGVLSREEAEAAPNPASFRASNFLVQSFGGSGGARAKMDANNDGKVTRKEFAQYIRDSGLPPFSLNTGNEPQQGMRMANRFNQPKPSTADLNKALMKLLDTNGDGKLSRAELAAAPQAFRKLDLDEDEIITQQELLPGSNSLYGL